VWAGERRSSARASVLNQRRNSVFSDTQESLEKIRDGDNMNNSFRIQFEDIELQQEQSFVTVACQHIMILNNLSVFSVVGKFWHRVYFCLRKDSRVNPIPHQICTEHFTSFTRKYNI
jgi:hypothetical protein